MTNFYHKALVDERIGDFFVVELGEDLESEEWQEHIDLLVNFWATLFLKEERYKGDPFGPHFSIIGLEKEDFDRWEELFCEVAKSIYVPEIAKLFEEKAAFYAKDFMQKLQHKRDEADLKRLKSKISWEG